MTTLKTFASLVLVLFSASTLAQEDRIDVDAIRTQINRSRAGWTSGETSISRLPLSEIRRMLGLGELVQGGLDYRGTRGDPRQASAIDWRNKDGINWLGPVMNQGNCGSCVAFAAVASLEARASISAGLPWLRPTFSPQQLFSCGGGGCESGWLPDSAARVLQSKGIVDEACMPYTSGSTGQDVSCSQKCSDASQRSVKIAGYSKPSSWFGGSAEAVKAALKNGPLVTTLNVRADFVTYKSGIYKSVTGSTLGGHAVSLVGYDDSRRAWLIRNSWGTEWGENGFGWVSWDDTSGVGSQTWGFDLNPTQGGVSVATPSDREVASSVHVFSARAAGLKGASLTFRLKSDGGKEVASTSCVVTPSEDCMAPFDTTVLADGRYEVVVETGATRSLPREFFVLNSEPVMKLALAGKDGPEGPDLSKPLTGRPEFQIRADYNRVPIQRIEFRAIDSQGNVVSAKSNEYVLPEMLLGWRTMTVPNGEYTILVHGETTWRGKVYTTESNSFKITVKN